MEDTQITGGGGGSGFMARMGLVDYEAAADAVPVDGGGNALEAEPVVAAVPDPVAPAPAAGWMPSGPEELQNIIFQTFEELLQQPTVTPDAAPQLPEYDVFNPESVRAHATAGLQEMFEREIGPLRELMGTFAEERGRVEATKALDAVAGEIGEFNRDQAVSQAAWLVSQGVNPRQAIRQAAEATRQFEQQIRTQAIAEHVAAQTAMHDPANAEPPGGGSSASEIAEVHTGAGRYKQTLKDSLARHGLASTPSPVG